MAITQSSLAEDPILSRQERVVLRGVYRAAQLAEALAAIGKVQQMLDEHDAENKKAPSSNKPAEPIKAWLCQAIVSSLVSTRVPTSSQGAKKEESL